MRAAEARVVLDSAIDKLDERLEALLTFGLSGTDLTPTVRYGPTLRVLRDLVSQGGRSAETTKASSSTLPVAPRSP